ncbi:hypothetical protein NFI96_023393, partial [Prochilodus magdalenae]
MVLGKIMSAPNVLRVGTPENVFVEAQDYSGGDLQVRIIVKNFPLKTQELESKSVVLTAGNNYQAVAAIQIPGNKGVFSDDPLEKQYVYLEAHFPSGVLEKVVMVSFQSGYIFIQTDKSIYTPGSTVRYRIFALSADLQPLDRRDVSVRVANPQGIVIFKEVVTPRQGTLTGQYHIRDVASPGIWTIAVQDSNTPQKNFTAEFEVKEYVLPTFEVTLTPSKSFFYVDDQELQVDITAKYLFGNKVDGTAYVVFGVMHGDSKTSLPASLRRVTMRDGAGRATLTKDMILKTFRDIAQLVGSSLYISVSVLTETGSEIVEAQRMGIPIVTSPYTIHFKRTAKFFKPGMPFDVMVYVTNPDQTPAANVDLVVTPGDERCKTTASGMAKVTVNTQAGARSLQINVKTNDPAISNSRQDEKEMTAQAYATKGSSNNYLHIHIDAVELNVGDYVKAILSFSNSPGFQSQDITYLILSKGQIVQANRFKRRGQSLVFLSIPVTKVMLPSFRVVAYYHVGASEVVADSVWVDVKDTCMGTLRVEVRDPKRAHEPGERFDLRITGDPGAKVGLVAVDKGVLVLNKNRLTQDKVWNIIEKHDTGCTTGSGKDSMGVFYDAGLLFESDNAGGTESRTTTGCPTPLQRRRRAVTVQQITHTLTGTYSGALKQCCVDGLKRSKLGYTCKRRAAFISDGEECVKAFLHCCEEMEARRLKKKEEEMTLARSEEDDDFYISSDEITSRTQFPKSWLWEDAVLPSCQAGQCATTTLNKQNYYMPDSITTWQILAISLSKTHGICVADPLEIVVRKDFFLDLKLPYSAVRNEQIEIKAILHNFSHRKMKVRVELTETEHVCSLASKKGLYRTTVNVEAKSSRSISYIVIPLELGDQWIEVKAAAFDSTLTDGVRKALTVVPEGVLTTVEERNVELNPSKVPGGVQVLHVKGQTPDNQIPNTPAYTYITVAGWRRGGDRNWEQVLGGTLGWRRGGDRNWEQVLGGTLGWRRGGDRNWEQVLGGTLGWRRGGDRNWEQVLGGTLGWRRGGDRNWEQALGGTLGWRRGGDRNWEQALGGTLGWRRGGDRNWEQALGGTLGWRRGGDRNWLQVLGGTLGWRRGGDRNWEQALGGTLGWRRGGDRNWLQVLGGTLGWRRGEDRNWEQVLGGTLGWRRGGDRNWEQVLGGTLGWRRGGDRNWEQVLGGTLGWRRGGDRNWEQVLGGTLGWRRGGDRNWEQALGGTLGWRRGGDRNWEQALGGTLGWRRGGDRNWEQALGGTLGWRRGGDRNWEQALSGTLGWRRGGDRNWEQVLGGTLGWRRGGDRNWEQVLGQEVSQTIEQAISGDFMGRLIVQPSGSGEQTMIFMTLPVITVHYLDTTKQWEKVGVHRRAEAVKHIQTGETLPWPLSDI